MKNMNRYGLGLALALGLLVANAGFAQTITQPDQKKSTDSCCAMACCSHDSAATKDAKEHAKHEGCCGDSCNMKMKDGAKQMNHTDMAGCCGCCGDSCDMNMKDMKHKEKAN